MTTPAQLTAQIVDILARWDAQQDQLSDWLTGAPDGGPNGDGRYPLTNAQGQVRLFTGLAKIIDTVEGPAGVAGAAAALAGAEADRADAAASRALTDRNAVQALRDAVLQDRTVVGTQRDDVAAKWAEVRSIRDSMLEDANIVGRLLVTPSTPPSPRERDLWVRTGPQPKTFVRVSGAWVELTGGSGGNNPLIPTFDSILIDLSSATITMDRVS